MPGRVNPPKSCALWHDPESVLSGPLEDAFELLKTFVKDSHWWRYLLKCRECGQLYVFEFREEVDWADGDDPQFSSWIPVETAEEAERVRALPSLDLRTVKPQLRKDWPKGEERKVYWVRDDP